MTTGCCNQAFCSVHHNGRQQDAVHHNGRQQDAVHHNGRQQDAVHHNGRQKDAVHHNGPQQDAVHHTPQMTTTGYCTPQWTTTGCCTPQWRIEETTQFSKTCYAALCHKLSILRITPPAHQHNLNADTLWNNVSSNVKGNRAVLHTQEPLPMPSSSPLAPDPPLWLSLFSKQTRAWPGKIAGVRKRERVCGYVCKQAKLDVINGCG